MPKERHVVKAQCPACAFGTVSHLSQEWLRENFIGDEKEIDILCPMCGTKHTGKLVEEHVQED